MSIKKEFQLYHGTSESQLNHIKEVGFNNKFKDYSYYLSAKGVYFVADRPSIAFKFAKNSVRKSVVGNDSPVVFSIKLKNISENEILDLTTDSGLNVFWNEYQITYKAYNSEKSEVTREMEKLYPEYFSFLKNEKAKTIPKEFLNYYENFMPDFKPNKTNIDSFVLDWLTRKYKVIIAVIQEGNPFQYTLFKNELNYESIPAFKGIRLRDHIEICVTDTSCIDKESILNINNSDFNIENEFLEYIVIKDDKI